MTGGTTTTPGDPRRRLGLGAGLPAIVVGIVCTTLSRAFDGFVQGLLSGAGIMAIILGAYLVGSMVWPGHRGDGDHEWLPSRDGAGPRP